MAEQTKNELAVADENTQIEMPESKADYTLNYLDGQALKKLSSNATVLSKSQLLPERFRNKPEDVMLLMDLAARMKVPLFALAKAMYIVHGEIGLSGQFCISLINACGRFSAFTPVYVGEPDTAEYGCYGVATRLSDGVVCKSTTITLGMAQSEGWMRNSKWKTMTDQMLAYRAAAFFARVYCPDVLCGLQTTDEITDVRGEDTPKQNTRVSLNEVYVQSEVVE